MMRGTKTPWNVSGLALQARNAERRAGGHRNEIEVALNCIEKQSEEGGFMRKEMLLGLVLILSVPFASATSLEEQLRKDYVGTQQMLRHFYDSGTLKFDRDGNPTNTGKEGPWTIFSGVIIESLQLGSGKLELHGHRRMLTFDNSIKRLNNFESHRSFRIEVQTQDGPDQGAQISAALARVFVPSRDLVSVVPDYWRDYIAWFTSRGTERAPCESSQAKVAADATQPATQVRVSSGVANGLKIHDVAPIYPVTARMYQIEGDLVVRAVIDRDGVLGGICIVQALGAGLDDSAVDAIRQWKYRPYIFNGEPVVVETTIKVQFHIH
jgi:TonB family protein